MSQKDEIIAQWKQAEKATFKEAFQRLVDEAAKNTVEYLQEHPFQRSKFTLFCDYLEAHPEAAAVFQ